MNVVCIHGFSTHRRHPGFSEALKENTRAIAPNTMWREIIWDDILPPQGGILGKYCGAAKSLSEYFSHRGDAIRERIAEALDERLNPEGAVLVGHSMGGIIAYDVMTGFQLPAVKGLVMLGAPIPLVNGLTQILDNRRLPQGLRAAAFYNENDYYCEGYPINSRCPGIQSIKLMPPPGTHGLEHHKFYWRDQDVAKHVAELAKAQ